LATVGTVGFGESTTIAAETLALCLEAYVDEPSLIEVVFGCMRCFASKSENLQKLLCNERNIEMFINVMNTHMEGEGTVQEQGCLLVCELAKNSEPNSTLLKKFDIVNILEQASTLILNERNKKYPTLALEALNISDEHFQRLIVWMSCIHSMNRNSGFVKPTCIDTFQSWQSYWGF
jgi:hypothetical protein